MTSQKTSEKVKQSFDYALMFWMVWALLPIPLLWLALYTFKAFWMAILLYAGLICCGPFLYFRFRKLEYLRPVLTLKFSKALMFKLLLLILLSWLALEGGWWLLKASIFDWASFAKSSSSIGIKLGVLFWVLVIYFVILNPVVEECFWRGLVYERFKAYFSPWTAILLSSLLFGLWHWVIIQYFFVSPWQYLLTLLVCFGGIIFTLLYEKTGSLLPGILVHGIGADLAIMLILWEALTTVPR